MAKYTIFVRRKDGTLQAEDTAETEDDARQQASGWTGQHGQMTWVARIYAPNGDLLATYRRGVSVVNMDRKKQVELLLARFGTCGCKDHCQKEQYAAEEEANKNKPNGRFSQCEVECDKLRIPVPEKTEED